MPLLAPYDPNWKVLFEKEEQELARVLGPIALRIEHVGSTAVYGLAAKPVIDIQVSVARVQPLERLAEPLARLGYQHLPLPEPPAEIYPFFHRPPRWPTTHHVHVCEQGGEEEIRHLAFRDWLREHPEDLRAYEAVKMRLAKDVDETDPVSLARYSAAKGDFVREVERRARAASG